MRKIVQIAAIAVDRLDGEFPPASGNTPALYALCDDGSLWETYDSYPWHRLPAIPQETEE